MNEPINNDKNAPAPFNGDYYKGQLNSYNCKKCLGRIVTIDRDAGVTPFAIKCKFLGCNGEMHSSFYRGVVGTPTFEWRHATTEEIQGHARVGNRGAVRHAENDGLFLHPIEETPKKELVVIGPTPPMQSFQPQEIALEFRDNARSLVGKFSFDKVSLSWQFEGNAAESAKKFIEYVQQFQPIQPSPLLFGNAGNKIVPGAKIMFVPSVETHQVIFRVVAGEDTFDFPMSPSEASQLSNMGHKQAAYVNKNGKKGK